MSQQLDILFIPFLNLKKNQLSGYWQLYSWPTYVIVPTGLLQYKLNPVASENPPGR